MVQGLGSELRAVPGLVQVDVVRPALRAVPVVLATSSAALYTLAC